MCNSSSGGAASLLTGSGSTGAAGASHDDASWLAFCASASQGLVVVENQEFALPEGAVSGAGASVVAASGDETAGVETTGDESTGIGGRSKGLAIGLAARGTGGVSTGAPFVSTSCFAGFVQESSTATAAGLLAFISNGGALMNSGWTADSNRSCVFSRVGDQLSRRLARDAGFSAVASTSSANASLPPSRRQPLLSESSSSSSSTSSDSDAPKSLLASSGLIGAI